MSRAKDMPRDWEDEFRRLKEKYDQLKVDFNEKDKHNLLLQSKIRQLEGDLSKIDRQMGVPRTAAAREEVNLVGELQSTISKLKAQNTNLVGKNEQLNELVEKKKRELATAKRAVASSKKAGATSAHQLSHNGPARPPTEVDIFPAPTGGRKENMTAASINVNLDPHANTGLLELSQKMKARLIIVEEQLVQLKDENDRLRNSRHTNTSNVDLENQLREANWKLQSLQTQYDYLQSKVSGQGDANRGTAETIEEYSQKIRELRRLLEELRHEKELSDAKAARTASLEDVVAELRQANRSLEDKIARLCEAPFIKDAFGQQESRLQYDDLMQEREDLIAKVNHLQEAVRTHFSALTSLKQHASELREEKEEAEKMLEEMRLSMQELESGKNMLQDQLRLYSGDDGVDMESLERALTLVKRRGEAVTRLPFLEDPNGESLVTLPALKRKLEECQITNLKITEDNERLENMLKLQATINKDLHKELETLVRSRDKDKTELQRKAEDFEEVALKRLDKIHLLEAQVRQFVYGLAKSGKGNHKGKHFPSTVGEMPDDTDLDASFAGSDNGLALLNELVDDAQADGINDLKPDENLLEIWIKSATVKDGILVPGSSSFTVVDFFDYESQTTSLLSGLKPQWDFATTYKLTVDDFLLRYLATNVATFELNMASQGDFTMLARCSVPLSALLKSKPRVRLVNYPMLSVKTGQIIAHINVDVRLALPVSELYRLFLERHPGERRHIEEMSAKRVIDAAATNQQAINMENSKVSIPGATEDESRLFNELEIIIHKAINLPLSPDGKPPDAYINFQLLGYPETISNPVMESLSPEFHTKFNFPMVTNDQQLRLLQRSKLQVLVIDMKGEELDTKNEGLIGDVGISLAALTEGVSTSDSFIIKNPEGQKAGELVLSVRWKHPLKKQRELGPRSLSGLEVETLITSFAPGDFEQGVVDYNAFCRFADPPREVLSVMDKLRVFCRNTGEQEGRTSRDIFSVVLNDGRQPITMDHFRESLLKTQIDSLPADYDKLFLFIDTHDDGVVTLDKFLAVLNLDEIAGISPLLQRKLQDRVKDLSSRGVPPIKIFQDADQWGANGIVTRMEFKNCLRRMGFSLVDEPDPSAGKIGFDEPGVGTGVHAHKTGARSAAGGGGDGVDGEDGDMLNDTMGSEGEDILVAAGMGVGAGGDGPERKGDHLKDHFKQQREIFEEKRTGAEKASQQALAAAHSQSQAAAAAAAAESQASEGDERPKSVTMAPSTKPQSAAEIAADPYGQNADHRVSTLNNNPPTGIAGAEKVPEQYYAGMPPSSSSSAGAGAGAKAGIAETAAVSTSMQNLPRANILVAEDIIVDATSALAGGTAIPDVSEGFARVDPDRKGFVNRKQFAHVISMFPVLQLHGIELRACMDFFDTASDGTKIDYNSFLRFYSGVTKMSQMDRLPAIQKLQSMIFHKRSIARFKESDSAGTGFLKRSDMLRCLTELGYGQISQSIVMEMMQLFETHVEGQVNYPNFVEYVRENEYSRLLDQASRQLYNLFTVTTGIDGTSEKLLREWFSKLDTEGIGKFTISQFFDFLMSHDLEYPKDVVAALYSEFDPDGLGVLYSMFSNWLSNHSSVSKQQLDYEMASFAVLSTVEMQHKAHTYMLAVADSIVTNPEFLAQSFQVYDWRDNSIGAIGQSLFMRGAIRAGFPFTKAELRELCSEFSVGHSKGDVVSYKKFLAWCTPGAKAMKARAAAAGRGGTAGTGGAPGQHRATVNEILKFLEKAQLRGIVLEDVFGRYDAMSVGRITSSEFSSALSDLGMSSVTARECIEFAERIDAAAADFVLYRRVISAVLRSVDEATGAADIDVIDSLKLSLRASNVDPRQLQDVFQYYDRKGNGYVRVDDMPIIFDEAKMKIRRSELAAISKKYAIEESGQVQYPALFRALDKRLNEKSAFKIKGRSDGALPDELHAKLKTMIEQLILRGKDYRGEFDKFDDQFSGSMLQTDFREVMTERLRSNLNASELEIVEKAYRYTHDPRRVNYAQMIHDIRPRNFGRAASVGGAFNSELSGGEAWEIAETLRQKIRRRCEYTSPGELRKPYRHFGRRKSESGVTLGEFATAIRDIGLRVSADQEKYVFDCINLSGGDSFKYNDFVVFVVDPQHTDIIWKLRRSIARTQATEKMIISAVSDQDTNGSGLITGKQFLRAMKACQIDLTESDVARLLLRFDTEESQRFDVDKFCRFLRGRAMRDEDDEHWSDDDEEEDVVGGGGGGRSAAVSTRASRDKSKSKEAIELHVWKELKLRVEDKLFTGYTPNEVFAIFDPDERGTLELMALQAGAKEVGVPLSRPEVRALLRKMSAEADGPVDRSSFFDALDIDILDYAGKDKPPRRRPRGDEPDDDFFDENDDGYGSTNRRPRENHTVIALRKRRDLVENFVEALKRASRSDAESNELVDDLLEAFRREDRNRNSTIGKHEFSKALAATHIKLRTGDERDLIDTIASTRAPVGHEIRYKEFVEVIRGETSSGNAVNDVIVRLKARFARDGYTTAQMERIFEVMDRDGNGDLDTEEFAHAMKKVGLPITRVEASKIIQKFSVNGVSIKYKEFLRAFHSAGNRDGHEGRGSGRGEDDDRSDTPLDRSVKAIITKIRRSLQLSAGSKQSAGSRMKRAFEDADTNGDGVVSPREFREIMKELRVDVTVSEINEIYEKFDRSGDKRLDYGEFLVLLNATESRATSEDTDRIMDDIRRRIEDYLGPGAGAARKLKETFAEIDRNGNGQLEKPEFARAMSTLGVDLSRKEIQSIYDQYDADHSNTLDYTEFITLLQYKPGDRGPRGSDPLVQKIRHEIEAYLGPGANHARKVKEVFSEIDRNNNGHLDKREFMKAMDVLRVTVSRDDIDALYEKYDKDRSNTLDYNEFLELLQFRGDVGAGAKRQDPIIEKIRSEIEAYLGPGANHARKVKEVFAEIDRDGNNQLDKRELMKAMDVLRVTVSRSDIDLLFERYDKDRSNTLDYNEFLELLQFRGDVGAGAKRQDPIIEKIRSEIEAYLGPGANHARKVKEVFSEIDRNNNGHLDKREFMKAMDVLRVTVSRDDIDALYEKYDKDRSNTLDYNEFLELLQFRGDVGAGAKRQDPIIEKIRSEIEAYLGPGANHARKVKEVFAEIDRDGNNQLDKRELMKAMDVLRVTVSRSDIDLLFERYDKDRSNTLDYNEFLELLQFRGDSSSARGAGGPGREDPIIEKIRSEIEAYLGPGANHARKVKEVFAEIDRNNNGHLDKREFLKAMDVLRVTVSRNDIDALYEKYDKDRSNTLDYNEFLSLMQFDTRRGGGGASSDWSGGSHNDPVVDRIQRGLVDYLGRGQAAASKIKEAFSEIDADNNGHLDKREFMKAMDVLRVTVSRNDIDALYEKYDKDRSNTLDYNEFMRLVGYDSRGANGGGGSNSHYDSPRGRGGVTADRDDVNALVSKIRRELTAHMGGRYDQRRVKDTFDEIDRNRNGSLEKLEFLKAMEILRIGLTRPEVDLLYRRFDSDHNGTLNLREFMGLLEDDTGGGTRAGDAYGRERGGGYSSGRVSGSGGGGAVSSRYNSKW